MSQPVTTNPWIIMLINMTVVFLVLAALGLVIKFIHYIDPTKSKLEAEDETAVSDAPPVVPAVSASPEPVANGVSPEVVAVIAAAIASYGCEAGQIHSIRPIERMGWRTSVRTQITQRS